MGTRALDIGDDTLQEAKDLDDEDLEDLLIDCLNVISEQVHRKQPKHVLQCLIALERRLSDVVSYTRIH